MSSSELEAQVRELMDREAIRECMNRYCRGIDRQDEDALRSAYWPDATDRHGAYRGSASGFIDHAMKALSERGERSVHSITNLSIELHGAEAAVETYFLALQRDRDPEGRSRSVFLAGRYVDRFEKRGSEWRIAARTVVYDWMRPLDVEAAGEAERFGPRQPIGGLKPDDPLYELLSALRASGGARPD